MPERKKFSTNTPSERKVGYSRAIQSKDGQRLYLSGTTSQDEEGNTQGSTVYEQSDFVFNKIKGVVSEAGFSEHDIVLLRAFLTDMNKIHEFDKAFIKHFTDINPCCTLVGTSALVTSELLIEVECIVDKG